jgi:hypothetical protein
MSIEDLTDIIEYRLSQLLANPHISVKFIDPILKIYTAFSIPNNNEIQSIIEALKICQDHLATLPIKNVTIYGLKNKRTIVWKKSFSIEEVLSRKNSNEHNSDLFSFHNEHINQIALPTVFMASALFYWSKIDLLLLGMRIWIHEVGHATIAWFSGRKATPLPFGWTNVSLDRSVIVYICFLTLWGLLLYGGYKEQKRWTIGIASAAILLQFLMTWFNSQDTFEMLFAFGGVGGEFYISTLLVVGFYLPLPDQWNWGFWRYLALFMGASTFLNSFSFWHQIKQGNAEIPWGTMFNGSGDSGGDMNQLIDFGWSNGQIVNTYNAIGQACLWTMLIIYGLHIIKSQGKNF